MAIQEVTSPPFLDDTAQTMVNKLDAIKNAINPNAQGTSYSNATSGLSAENVQEAVDELDSNIDTLSASLTKLGTIYSLDSKNVTSIATNTDTTIYGKVLPAGKYILSAKIYCNVQNAVCYIASGSLRQQIKATDIAYLQFSGLVISDGTTEVVLNFYQNMGTTLSRPYTYDAVNLVRLT